MIPNIKIKKGRRQWQWEWWETFFLSWVIDFGKKQSHRESDAEERKWVETNLKKSSWVAMVLQRCLLIFLSVVNYFDNDRLRNKYSRNCSFYKQFFVMRKRTIEDMNCKWLEIPCSSFTGRWGLFHTKVGGNEEPQSSIDHFIFNFYR